MWDRVWGKHNPMSQAQLGYINSDKWLCAFKLLFHSCKKSFSWASLCLNTEFKYTSHTHLYTLWGRSLSVCLQPCELLSHIGLSRYRCVFSHSSFFNNLLSFLNLFLFSMCVFIIICLILAKGKMKCKLHLAIRFLVRSSLGLFALWVC